MPDIFTKAKRYSNTPEAIDIFEQIGWKVVNDQTKASNKKKVVNKGSFSTPLIDMDWEEVEYD